MPSCLKPHLCANLYNENRGLVIDREYVNRTRDAHKGPRPSTHPPASLRICRGFFMPYNMGEYYEHTSDYDLEYQGQSEQDLPFWREIGRASRRERV